MEQREGNSCVVEREACKELGASLVQDSSTTWSWEPAGGRGWGPCHWAAAHRSYSCPSWWTLEQCRDERMSSPRSSLPLFRAVPSEFQHVGVLPTWGSTGYEGESSGLVSSGKWVVFSVRHSSQLSLRSFKICGGDFSAQPLRVLPTLAEASCLLDSTVVSLRHWQPCLPLSTGLESEEVHLGFLGTLSLSVGMALVLKPFFCVPCL